MIESILMSLMAFISTNIDDLFINMLFFAQHRTKTEARSIVAGKYLGMGALTAVSLLGAYGLRLLPGKWLSLLGLVPIGLGVKEIVSAISKREEADDTHPSSRTLWLSMMLVTIANGADNIGVYLPLFAAFSLWQMGWAIVVFALVTGLWCALSKQLTGLPMLQKLLSRYKHILIPLVYLLLGFYILFF